MYSSYDYETVKFFSDLFHHGFYIILAIIGFIPFVSCVVIVCALLRIEKTLNKMIDMTPKINDRYDPKDKTKKSIPDSIY